MTFLCYDDYALLGNLFILKDLDRKVVVILRYASTLLCMRELKAILTAAGS